MSDILRYVTLDVGGRPVTQLDIADGTIFGVVRDSFTANPPAKTQTMSVADRRYGGSHQVAETTDNGSVSWQVMVFGPSQDTCIEKLEQLLATIEANPTLQFLQWKPDGASQSSLYDVRGTATWSGQYQWAQFAGAGSLIAPISIPTAPLARGLPFDILDTFTVDTRGDYTYDAGAEANEEVAGGELKAAANVATEQRAMHTARGYQYADNQQTIKGTPKATITGYKAGVALKRTAATTALEVYVDDEGTNSRLRIDKLVAGVRTNLATTNLAARVSSGTPHWVRGRIEGNVVTAEHFTAAPSPMGAPTLTNTYTLTAGAEREAFGTGVKGQPGRLWIPKTIGAALDEYAVEPFTYRNQSLPAKLALSGSIPGDGPALADVTVTPSGGAAAPIWALLGWANAPAAGLAQAPFGIIEAETGGNLSGWASTANAGARGGNMLKDAAALSTDVYTASYELDPSLMTADAFSGEVAVEVWARVFMDSTIVTPSLTLSTRPFDGLNYGSARYTDEWGSGGKLLVPPGSGTGKWRFVRLGTLRMLVDPLRPRKWLLWLAGSVGAGTAGEWGVDYLILGPSTARACSPSSKPNDGTFPPFVSSTNETSKTIKRDLSALVCKPPNFGHPDHGLGGQLLELPPGEDELLVKLSSLVPDDPTSDATTEQLAHTATVHAAITPRWQFLRSGS